MKTILFLLLTTFLVTSFVSAQLPVLDVKNLSGQKIIVHKQLEVPLQWTSDGTDNVYTIYDSIRYQATFDTLRRITDSTFLVELNIKDYKKVIYANEELLVKDSINNYTLSYVVTRDGKYMDIFIDERIALLEGFFRFTNALSFDELDIHQHNNPILSQYRLGSRYRNLQDVKPKVFQELYWLHLFSAATPGTNSTCNSSQAVWLDLNMVRTPSILRYEKKGNNIQVHQEVDYVRLYRGMVSEEDLKTIETSDPEDFFFRIYSDAVYTWDYKRNIPKAVDATLKTSVKSEGGAFVKTDSYKIEFVR